MSDISGISSSQKLTSQLKASMETNQKQPEIEMSSGLSQIQQFDKEMEQINHALALMKEIRTSLERHLE